MDDFSLPNVVNKYGVLPSTYNRIEPFKRPLSSTCPAIIINSKTGNLALTLGGAGGTKITTAETQVILRHLFLKDSIKMSIDASRLHHQLLPNVICYDDYFPENMLEALRKLGHQTVKNQNRLSIIVAISKNEEGEYDVMYDYRKGGSSAGY